MVDVNLKTNFARPWIDVRTANDHDEALVVPGQSGGLTKTIPVLSILDAIESAQKDFSRIGANGGRYNHSFEDINEFVNSLDEGDFYFLGTMLGEPLSVGHDGKFRLGTVDELRNQWQKERAAQAKIARRAKRIAEENAKPACEHGFVVRDIQGENRWHCKECDQRWERHPKAPAPKNEHPILDAPLANLVAEEFSKGIHTFSEAVRQAQVSVEEFKEVFEEVVKPKLIVEETHTIGNPTPIKTVIGTSPARVSDPEEVDAIFTDAGVKKIDLNRIWRDAFPDITDVEIYDDHRNMNNVVNVTFVDGTKQRVEISHMDIKMAAGNQMSKYTMPLVRKAFPAQNPAFTIADPNRID